MPVFPFGQNLIDRGVRGDYINFFGELDFTVPRLKRSLLLGTRWGDENATLVPAPGEPYYQQYTYDPLGLPLAPPPPGGPLGAVPGIPADAATARRLPPGRRASRQLRRHGRRRAAARRPEPHAVRRTSPAPTPGVADADAVSSEFSWSLFTIASVDRHHGDGLRLHPGADAAGHRPHHRQTGAARGRRAVPVQQRHLPRRRGRQGHRRAGDRRQPRRSHAVPGHVAEDPREPGGQGAQRLRGRRTVRRPAAAERLAALPARRVGDRARPERQSPNQSGRCSTGSTRWWAPSQRTSSARCSTNPSRPSTAQATTSGPCWTPRRRSSSDLNGVADQNRTLVDDSVPLLDSQAQTDRLAPRRGRTAWPASPISWHSTTHRCAHCWRPARTSPQEVSRLLEQVKPTLPVLLANLTSIGQVLMTYNKSIQQLLVLFPPYLAGLQSVAPINNPTGQPMGDFAVSVADPPACTVGFLPPSQWRSPADTHRRRHPGRAVLQAAAGFADRRPRGAQLSVRRAPRKACRHRAGVQQRQAVHATGHAAARARAVSVRSQPDRPGHPARPPRRFRRHALRPGRGHPAPPPGRSPLRTTRTCARPDGPRPPIRRPRRPRPSSFTGNGSRSGRRSQSLSTTPRPVRTWRPDGRLYHQSNLATARRPHRGRT